MAKIKYVNDNVHGLIRLTDLESSIMSQPIFNRLHNVYQNSVAYLTWPSNRNQRFEHSIGSMHLAGEMAFYSFKNADPKVLASFLEQVKQEISKLLDTSTELPDIVSDDHHRLMIDLRNRWKKQGDFVIKKEACGWAKDGIPLPEFLPFLVPCYVSDAHRATCYLTIQAIRLAGMLHDIGHPPFSHAVENALEDLYIFAISDAAQDNTYSDETKSTERVDEFISAMKRNMSKGKKLHEAMGDELTELLFKRIVKDALGDDSKRSISVDLLGVEYCVLGEMVKKIFANEGIFSDLHTVVDSMVDADRLDFVSRDSLSSGLGIGAVPHNQIIDSMKLVESPEEGVDRGRRHLFEFAFSIKAAASISTFLRQRYQNYDTIVFHHHVVKTEMLLSRVILTLGKRYLWNKHHEEDSTPDGRIPQNISGLWDPFVPRPGSGTRSDVLMFGQWNDAWFISMLTGEYISVAADNSRKEKPDHEDLMLEHELASLLYGKKGYASVIKRYNDIKVINDAFFAKASEKINDLKEFSRECTMQKEASDKAVGVAAAQRVFNQLLPRDERDDDDSLNITLSPMDSIRREYIGLLGEDAAETPESFLQLIDNMVEEFKVETPEITEALLINRRLNAGFTGRLYLYDDTFDDSSPLVKFEDYSNIRTSITIEELRRPSFFIFLHFTEGTSKAKIREIIHDLQVYLGERLFYWYYNRFQAFARQAR